MYVVNKRVSHRFASPLEIRRMSIISDQAIYLRLDGHPSSEYHDAQVNAGEAYWIEHVRVVSRVAVIGVSPSTTPTVRWTAWGV